MKLIKHQSPLTLSVFSLAIFLPTSFATKANQNSLWLGYTQNESDYFGDGNSSIEPSGYNLGYSRILGDAWQISVGYGESDGKGRWPIVGFDALDLVDGADTESKNISLGVSWVGDSFALSTVYSEAENTERALTRIPTIAEIIVANDKVLSFSLDDFTENQDWFFGWSLGLQYAENDFDNLQIFFVEPVTSVATRFDQTNWSFFAEADVGRDFVMDSFTISPLLRLGWDWGISTSGDPLVLLTRGDERRLFTQFNDRFISGYRIPDSGYWDLSVTFDWHNDWRTSVGYGRTISAPIATSSITLDLSLDF